jgi:hypothetical protein
MEDIGMRPAGGFSHKGQAMVVYESLGDAEALYEKRQGGASDLVG